MACHIVPIACTNVLCSAVLYASKNNDLRLVGFGLESCRPSQSNRKVPVRARARAVVSHVLAR